MGPRLREFPPPSGQGRASSRNLMPALSHSPEVILCVANFFGKMFFPRFLLPLSTFCCTYSWGKRSEQLTLPDWGSCANLVKNRGVLCSWCNLFKNYAILERTSYQKNCIIEYIIPRRGSCPRVRFGNQPIPDDSGSILETREHRGGILIF